MYTLRVWFAAVLVVELIFIQAFGQASPAQAGTFSEACDLSHFAADIATSNLNTTDNTINLAANCTYTLNVTISTLTVSKTQHSLTINGNGAVIDGAMTYQIFNIAKGATLVLNAVTIQNGYTLLYGAGIHNFGTLTITGSTLSGNVSMSTGGAIHNNGTLTITNSIFSGNSANGFGGAIYNSDKQSTLTITNSTFSGNSVNGYSAGGIFNNGKMTISNSTFSANTVKGYGGFGGGIYNDNIGSLILTNSTLVGNTATATGGAIFNSGVLNMVSDTVTANSATEGGGIYNDNIRPLSAGSATTTGLSVTVTPGGIGVGKNGKLTVQTTIIAANTGTNPNISGNFASLGYNLLDDKTGATGTFQAHDLIGKAAMLDKLADNGGSTQTVALLPGSPAIDAIPLIICKATPTDQRSVKRPQGAACDIGAFEYAPTPATPTS